MKPLTTFAVLLSFAVQPVLAARAPDDKSKADFIVTGQVVTIYKTESGRLTGYIVRLRLADVEKGEGYKTGETFYAYCYQRRRSLLPLADDLGHSAVPKKGEMIRAHVHRREGLFEGNFPDWFEKLEESETLKKEMGQLVEETLEAAKKAGDPAPKDAVPKAVTAMLLAESREVNPLFLYVKPEREKAWNKGQFDEKSAAARIDKSIKTLTDFGVELPRLHYTLIQDHQAGKLSPARQELAAGLLEAFVAKFLKKLTRE